jgi:general stress protein CsbA
MNLLLRLIGLGLTLWGIYILGKNIFFTTQASPYFWRGIAADGSVLALTAGVLMLVLLPRDAKSWGLLPIILAIVLIIASGQAVLQPTSLWQLFLSLLALTAGYTLLTTGRIPL